MQYVVIRWMPSKPYCNFYLKYILHVILHEKPLAVYSYLIRMHRPDRTDVSEVMAIN